VFLPPGKLRKLVADGDFAHPKAEFCSKAALYVGPPISEAGKSKGSRITSHGRFTNTITNVTTADVITTSRFEFVEDHDCLQFWWINTVLSNCSTMLEILTEHISKSFLHQHLILNQSSIMRCRSTYSSSNTSPEGEEEEDTAIPAGLTTHRSIGAGAPGGSIIDCRRVYSAFLQ
jgi:hypothetical protein